jgi:NTP pyrophosphatase (non-canonical NTP hydrolase)
MNNLAKKLKAIMRKIDKLNMAEIRRHDDANVVLNHHFRHMVEEVGEVAHCLRGKNDEPLENEAVDTAICALAIALLPTGGEIEPLLQIFDVKLKKWEKRLEK